MQTIVFIRTAPYLYKLPRKSLYPSLDEIGLQIANPTILKPSVVVQEKINMILQKYNPDLIFSSEFIRSKETAKLFSQDIKSISELNEIKFSMHDFSIPSDLPNQELEKDKINAIRYNFAQALIHDELREKQKDVIKRILDFKQILNSTNLSRTVLCCSHGFIMKLFENFFRSNCQIKNLKNLILMHDWTKPPYQFLDGFVIKQGGYDKLRIN